MDGEKNRKPYEQMDDLGGKIPLFLDQHLIFFKKIHFCSSPTGVNDWILPPPPPIQPPPKDGVASKGARNGLSARSTPGGNRSFKGAGWGGPSLENISFGFVLMVMFFYGFGTHPMVKSPSNYHFGRMFFGTCCLRIWDSLIFCGEGQGQCHHFWLEGYGYFMSKK